MIHDRTLRIIRIMKEENMNATQFSEAIGIQRAAMSHILNGRNNPSVDVISKITERFKTVNPGWLLNGIGSIRIPSPSGEAKDNHHQWDENEIDLTANALPSSSNEKHSHQTLFDGLDDTQISSETQSQTSETDSEAFIPTESPTQKQVRAGEVVKPTENNTENAINEVIIYKEKPTKKIDKIVLFYSDQTYETFVRSTNAEDPHF